MIRRRQPYTRLSISMYMAKTLPAMFFDQARRLGSKPLFLVKRAKGYEPIAWQQARDTVQAFAAFLLQASVHHGDRILLLSENRPEWGMADLAIQSVRAWTVPIYPTLTEPELLHIARDCEPVICLVSSADQLRKIRDLRRQIPSLCLTVVMDSVLCEAGAEVSWDEALAQGHQASGRLTELMDRRLNEVAPDDTATLIYTSGTTGEPKGVMLSHRNFLSNAAAGLKAIPVRSTDLHLSFLPLSHVFERMAGWYLMLMAGASVAYAENMDTIAQNMLEVHPTIMLGVPRFFEKLYAKIQEGLQRLPPLARGVTQWAFGIGAQTREARLRRARLPMLQHVQWWLANLLVFRKFKRRLGGRLRFFVSGSAPLSKSIAEFFYDAGVVILEGYGLTETSPVITVNCPDALKFGTVGRPLDAVEVRIAEDGEILTRGAHVMQGYYRKPTETQEVLREGWFYTGDIGQLDPEGFLAITDRKKDLIKTAGGKFVAPQKLENLFVMDPCIAQAFVYGDREPYCVALVVPNLARVMDYAAREGLAGASPKTILREPKIREWLWSRIQALQQSLPSFEQVKRIALLDQEFTQAAGELTPTLKAKRAAIATRYQATIRQLYLDSSSAASALPTTSPAS